MNIAFRLALYSAVLVMIAVACPFVGIPAAIVVGSISGVLSALIGPGPGYMLGFLIPILTVALLIDSLGSSWARKYKIPLLG